MRLFLIHWPPAFCVLVFLRFLLSSRTLIKADLLMLLVTLIASSGWVFTKEALSGFPPLLFMGIRFLLAAFVVGLIGRVNLGRLSRQQCLLSICVGLLFGVAMIMWVLGVASSEHLGEGAFITSLGMILVPWASFLLYREAIRWSHILSMLLASAGLCCLLLNHGLVFQVSQLLFLGAAILLSFHFALNSRVSSFTSTLSLTTIQLGIVGIICLLAAAFMEEWPQTLGVNHWLWLALSVLIATSLRFFIQTEAQGITPVTHAALIMTLEPVWTAVLVAIWFGQGMSLIQMLGCVLIFIALVSNRLFSS